MQDALPVTVSTVLATRAIQNPVTREAATVPVKTAMPVVAMAVQPVAAGCVEAEESQVVPGLEDCSIGEHFPFPMSTHLVAQSVLISTLWKSTRKQPTLC